MNLKFFSVTDGILRSSKNCLLTNKPTLLWSCIQHTVILIRWKYYGNGSTSKGGTDVTVQALFTLVRMKVKEGKRKELEIGIQCDILSHSSLPENIYSPNNVQLGFHKTSSSFFVFFFLEEDTEWFERRKIEQNYTNTFSTLLEMWGAKKERKYSNIRYNKHLRWVEIFEYSSHFQYEKKNEERLE